MDFDGTLSWLSWVCAIFLFSYGFFQRTSTSAYYSDLETEFGLDGAGVGSLSSMYFYIYGIVQIKYNTSIMSLPPRVPTPYHDENGQSKGCK